MSSFTVAVFVPCGQQPFINTGAGIIINGYKQADRMNVLRPCKSFWGNFTAQSDSASFECAVIN